MPIAAVYVAAHYFTFLIFEGQAISYLASDPFGQGWDLFGTVDSGIDYTHKDFGGVGTVDEIRARVIAALGDLAP